MSSLTYHPPAVELRKFISVYYSYQGDEPHFAGIDRAALAQLRLMVAGYGEARFVNGAHYTQEPGLAVYGPTSAAMELHLHGPTLSFGFGVLAAGWAAFFGKSPACDYVDQVTLLAQLNPDLAKAMAPLAKKRRLEDFARAADLILPRFVARQNRASVQFTDMIEQWLSASIAPDLADLQDRAGLSARQLTRRTKAVYGFTPKFLARKYRALKAARVLSNPATDDIDYLRDAFYDQPHMIREVKLFTGVTPTRLRLGHNELARMIDARSALTGIITPLTAST